MATLTTELEAVNSMLAHIGESPVNSLSNTNSLPVAALTALTVLHEISREVQSEGWHFNTADKLTLSPSASTSKIELPPNTLFVDALDKNVDVVQRGLILYDRKNNTQTFTKEVVVKMMYLLDWSELYEAARRYIILRASRVFQGRLIGSRELEQLIARDEFQAKSRLEEIDASGSDRTIFDNYDVASRIGINRNYELL